MLYDIVLFTRAGDNEPRPRKFAWKQFISGNVPHELRKPPKKACPAFSPVKYSDGASRGKEGVEHVTMWVGDLDSLSDAAVEDFIERVTRQGWACLLYTTWRHSTDPNRLRAVIPLTRPVLAADWPGVWAAINKALGGYADPKCGKDVAHIYFGAFAPEGTEPWHHVIDGKPCDPDNLVSAVAVAAEMPEAMTPDALERFGKLLRRSSDGKRASAGKALIEVSQGLPFAEVKHREATIYALSLYLGRRWPDMPAEDIAALFRPSLSLMGRDCPTVDDVAYRIRRAQTRIKEQKRTEAEEQEQEHRRLISDAFNGERDTPYTDKELSQWPKHRWIIQHRKSYYTLVGGTYRGPYGREDGQNAIVRDLAPASSVLTPWGYTQTGKRVVKPLGELVRQYGTVAAKVVADMRAQSARYDESTQTLIEAITPLRDVNPVHHPKIQQWLETLAGDKSHALLSWIAAITLLDSPCTALFLTGSKAAGKGLFVRGLSKLWSPLGQTTALDDVLDTTFNEQTSPTPLIWADERLPRDFRGRTKSAALRQYIQARIRPLKRKGLPVADLIGAVRLVITANNERVLATSEDLSNDDIGAIADRYLHIPLSTDAALYLRDTEHETWVDHDHIAQHALWLRDNYVWQPNGRFLVHDTDTSLHSRLVSTAGIRSAVLQFCTTYLLDPAPLDAHPKVGGYIQVRNGQLLVNTQALSAAWAQYVQNEPCPPTGRLSSALAALCTEDTRVKVTVKGRRVNFRVLDSEHVYQWAVANGYATPDELQERFREADKNLVDMRKRTG